MFHPSAGSFPTSFLGPPLATAVDEEVVLLAVVVVVVLVEVDVTAPVELVEAEVDVAAVDVDGMHCDKNTTNISLILTSGVTLYPYLRVVSIQIATCIARNTSSSASPVNAALIIERESQQ